MEKNKLKKIGVIVIGALTLLSTSLSIAAIVRSGRGPHIPQCPPVQAKDHKDGHGPRGGHEPQGHENGPDMKPENGHGPQGHEDKPQGPKDGGKPGDEQDHRSHKKDENKQDDKSQEPGQNLEDKKDQSKEIH